MSKPSLGSISSTQLAWVSKNSKRPDSAVLVGQLAADLVRHGGSGRRTAHADILRAVANYVDDYFRRHCRLAGFQGGELVFLVNQADCLYHVRTAWHLALKEHLERVCPDRTFTKITFKLGDGGLQL